MVMVEWGVIIDGEVYGEDEGLDEKKGKNKESYRIGRS